MTTTEVSGRAARLKVLSEAERSAAPPVPRSVRVELRADCNLACRFCASARRPRPLREMDRRTFERIVRDLVALGVEQVGLFHIGEPFTCEWLADAIRSAKALGIRYVFLTTNGVLATADRVQACIDAGLDSLKFALNFVTPEQFSAATGRDAALFARVLENVRDAARVRDEVMERTGHRCRLSASSLEYSSATRAAMSNVIASVEPYVDEHYWLPLLGDMTLAPDEGRGAPRSSEARPKPAPCWSLFTEAHVAADGTLAACCLDASPRFAVGNVLDRGFLSAWHGEPFRSLRSAHLAGALEGTPCERCIAYA